MREAAFLRQNAERWEQFEKLLGSRKSANPDQLAELFVQVTDDLSYARTFYPKSKSIQYLNSLALKVHQAIYRNKRERSGRIKQFWMVELPLTVYEARRELLYSAIIFFVSMAIGALSTANDESFIRLILGDSYVNMTLENIHKGDPMAVYKGASEGGMFATITFNNIVVSFMVFVMGIFFSIGTAYQLFRNGVMLGAFQYFFHQKGLLLESSLVIWIHGTLEISAIIIAGAAGLSLGKGFLFPTTYSRAESFRRGAGRGLRIVVGLVPVFIVAGFLESFVTRHTEMPIFVSLTIILGSLAFILYYFVLYPYQLHKRMSHGFNNHT